MPKDLKVYANERVDLLDYKRGANDLTRELASFQNERVLIDNKARALEGFRVVIHDQTANPGQITVYNGSLVDRNGALVSDEDQVNASQSVTLTGANQEFYVEVVLTTVDTDTDSRAFWDPTIDNGGAPMPDGAETNITVATRTYYTWTIVTPVSTSGFAVTANPNSNRVPLARLRTDGSNQITSTAGVNTELATDPPSSTAELALAIGDTSVKVFDSRMFPSTGTMIITDGTSPVSVTITANDRENGLLSFNPALVAALPAGSRVYETTASAVQILHEEADPNAASFGSVPVGDHAVDRLSRMWQGNEFRGNALAASKYDPLMRSDLNLRNTKDFVDFISGQLEEMKWGRISATAGDQAPPTAFTTTPRYFDKAGGIAGARGAAITIGDGVASFGDFNGTDETPFIAALAHAAALASAVTIRVRPGTYTFTTSLLITQSCTIEGEGTFLSLGANPILVFGSSVVFRNISISPTNLSSTAILLQANGTVASVDCFLNGVVAVDVGSSGSTVDIRGGYCAGIDCSTNSAAFVNALGAIFYANTVFTGTVSSSATFVNCIIAPSATPGAIVITGTCGPINMTGCYVESTGVGAPLINIDATGALGGLNASACTFKNLIDDVTNEFAIMRVQGELAEAKFSSCSFHANTLASFTNASPGYIFYLDGTSTISFSSCSFSSSTECVRAVAVPDSATSYTISMSDCTVETSGRTIYFGEVPGVASIANNAFEPAGNLTEEYAAVYVVSSTETPDISIIGNKIRTPSTMATTAAVYGIQSVAGALANVKICDNTVTLAHTGGVNSYGVNWLGSGEVLCSGNSFNGFTVVCPSVIQVGWDVVSPAQSCIISDNIIENHTTNTYVCIESARPGSVISGNRIGKITTPGGQFYGIYMPGTNYSSTVRGNVIKDISHTATTFSCYGIFLDDCEHTVVSDNVISQITSAGIANTLLCSYIYVNGSNGCTISNNTCFGLTASAGMDAFGIFLSGCVGCTVSSNSVYTGTSFVGILAHVNGTSSTSIAVSNNSVTVNSDDTEYGILLTAGAFHGLSTVGTFRGVAITGNTVYANSAGASPALIAHIAAQIITGISISGNSVTDYSTVASTVLGIQTSGTGTVISNNTLTSNAVDKGQAIGASNGSKIVVSGNSCNWRSATDVIAFVSATEVSVIGNVLLASGGGSVIDLQAALGNSDAVVWGNVCSGGTWTNSLSAGSSILGAVNTGAAVTTTDKGNIG